MRSEGILKEKRKTKSNEKPNTTFYHPENEIPVFASTGGIFLKEVKVGTLIQQGQKIGETRDTFSGKRLEEIIAPTNGLLITLRQYPIIYEKEPIATILTTKKSWKKYLPWP
tara:strand:- start:325 stop:660 length:336 start_codon:yes stop_codon:yes gene_type:complete